MAMHFNSKSCLKRLGNFFRSIEFIRVELMWSRESWRHDDIQKKMLKKWGRNSCLQLSLNDV